MSEPRASGSPTLPVRSADGYRVRSSEQLYDGPIFTVRRDEVEFPDGSSTSRDVVAHSGAVAVLALDEQQRVVLIEQYRHPIAAFLWELPAGLRDVDGEPPVQAARRELVEEVGLAADDWYELVEVVAAPRPPADPVPSSPVMLWGVAWRSTDVDTTHARLTADGLDLSEVRIGRKKGTRIFTVRHRELATRTVVIGPDAGADSLQ